MKMTERQLDVIKKIAEGKTMKAIAADLNVSVKTVEYHYAGAKLATGIRTPVEAAHFGIARLGVALMYSLILLLAPLAHAGSLALMWDASATPGVTYVLYATTNSTLVETNLNKAQVIADVGTNTAVMAYPTVAGPWKFAVTAKLNNVQSVPSNILPATVPSPATNLVTVVLQYSAVLEGIGNSPTNIFLKLLPLP